MVVDFYPFVKIVKKKKRKGVRNDCTASKRYEPDFEYDSYTGAQGKQA
jgi:hypothetical protein